MVATQVVEIDDRSGRKDFISFDPTFETKGSIVSDPSMIGNLTLKVPIKAHRILDTSTGNPNNFASSLAHSIFGPILNIFNTKPAPDKYEVELNSGGILTLPDIPWKSDQELFVTENGTHWLLLPVKNPTSTEETFLLEAFSNFLLFGIIPIKPPKSHEWKHLDRVTKPSLMWFFNLLVKIITLGHIGNLVFFRPLNGQWKLFKEAYYSSEQNNDLINKFKKLKIYFIGIIVALVLLAIAVPFLFLFLI